MSYNNQLPVVYQYFTNIAAIQNVVGLQQIWLYKIFGGGGGGDMLLMCQSTTMWVYEAWIKTYYILFSKTYNSFGKVL